MNLSGILAREIKNKEIKAMEKYKAINEAVKNGDFTEFDKFNETVRHIYAKND